MWKLRTLLTHRTFLRRGSEPIRLVHVAQPVTNVYIDGFNLYYGALKGTGYKWLDVSALARLLLPKDRIKRIRYFTARVRPRSDDPQQALRQDIYLRALRTIRNLTIHFGRFQTSRVMMPLAKPGRRKRMALVIKTEEKGSDVNLASYLLLDAFHGDCDTAVVISNDSDLKQPIEMAKNDFGIKVGVVNPHPRRRRSLDLNPSFFKQLRKSAVKKCQFPSTLWDSSGKIFKPTGW